MTTQIPTSLIRALVSYDIGAGAFGVVGDGTTDDTDALQDAFDYVKANGGTLVDSVGKTFKTGAISLSGTAKPWVFRGMRGATKFVRKDDTVGTLFNSTSSGFPFGLHDFTVDCKHGTYANGNHGISIADMDGLRISGVTVVDYTNSAILVYATTPSTYGDCIIEDCFIDGGSAANNGMLIADMHRSGFRNCKAFNIPGSPGYGVQLKNACTYGFVTDCYAANCVGGLAFGQDTGSTAVKYCAVKGFQAVGCTSGFIAGYAEKNIIDGLVVDMSSAGENAIDLNTTCIGNQVRATILNVAALKAGVRARTGSTDNTIRIEYLNNLNTTGKAAIFDSGSRRNTVRVSHTAAADLPASGPQGLVADNSVNYDNAFIHENVANWASITLATDTLIVKNMGTTSCVIDTEGGAASDDLVTITGQAYEGMTLTLRTTSNVRDVTVVHSPFGGGNILLNGGANYTLNSVSDTLTLRYSTTAIAWCEVGRGDNV